MFKRIVFALLVGMTGFSVSAQVPNPQLQSASRMIGQSNFSGAEKLLRELVDNDSENAQAWYLLGVSQQALQRFEAALVSYDNAKRSPQMKSAAAYNRACALARLGRSDDAIAELKTSLDAGFNNLDQLLHETDFESLRNAAEFVALTKQLQESERLFLEEGRVIHRLLGEAAGDEFGWIARLVGDVDKDQVVDFLVTAPSHGNGNGKVYVYSGKSAKLLFSHVGQNSERLGNGGSSAGDVNGDSVPDVLVGAPNGPGGGAAYVYSGADGKLIRKLTPPGEGGQFGYKVCSLGDVDSDLHSDVFVTALTDSGTGAGYAFSGRTGKLIFQVAGEADAEKFGSAASCSNTGGEILLAVGAQDADTNRRGQVYVYEINKGEPGLRFKIQGDANSVNLGMMFVSFPGDVNRDGTMDVYASDFSDATAAPGAGKIVVCSGVDGKEFFSITGSQRGEGFGTSPSEAGDVNGDGIGDLIIGAWQNRAGAVSGGRCSLHDGATGKELDSWTCTQRGDTFGFDAVGMGDVDGDGNVDFLLTSGWANVHGPKTGRVFVVAGEDYQGRQK